MNVLWIPIFSMRSYETGKYAILKDGNFQLTLARALASNFGSIDIAVPVDSCDVEKASEHFQSLTRGMNIVKFRPLHYGMNAVETREKFWDLNREELTADIGLYGKYDLIISDITSFDLDVIDGPPIIYNFNITKLPELDRPYIDKFFEKDLASIEQSLFTTVLNPRQRQYILEVRPDLASKVIVHTKCAHKTLLPSPVTTITRSESVKDIVFWPFRISDKAYKFDEFVQAFEEQKLYERFRIIVTDPNDTLKTDKSFISKTSLSKEEYYQILADRPMIVMLDDIDTVLHPGTIEFFHYGCPTITFDSSLIQNPNYISNLDQLASALHYPVYNEVDMTDFVYDVHEVDPLYSKDSFNV